MSMSRPEAIILYNQGCEALREGVYTEAASYFRRALMLEPEAMMTRFNLGFALERADDRTDRHYFVFRR
jgi:Flp pilus assembly protein TadD